jgi:hypothetical protein
MTTSPGENGGAGGAPGDWQWQDPEEITLRRTTSGTLLLLRISSLEPDHTYEVEVQPSGHSARIQSDSEGRVCQALMVPATDPSEVVIKNAPLERSTSECSTGSERRGFRLADLLQPDEPLLRIEGPEQRWSRARS